LPLADRRVPLFILDNFLRRLVSPPEKAFAKFVSPGQVVADLGCGPGYFALPLAKLVGRGGKVFAVDFDQKAIERVRKKVSDARLEDVVESWVSSAAELGVIPDQSIDFVLGAELLCCMGDHSGALSQIKRILKKEGSAYLSVTKLAKKSDPRSVTKEEWRRILEDFRVVQSGETILSRWAVLSKKNGTSLSASDASGLTGPNSVCNCK
jgi:ubiquinone/menaquinone biosynthesis C-methylase UbiE